MRFPIRIRFFRRLFIRFEGRRLLVVIRRTRNQFLLVFLHQNRFLRRSQSESTKGLAQAMEAYKRPRNTAFLWVTKSPTICFGRFSNPTWWFTPLVLVRVCRGVSSIVSARIGRWTTVWNTFTWSTTAPISMAKRSGRPQSNLPF